MKPPVPTRPRSQQGESLILQTQGFRPAVLACAAALVVLLVAGMVAGLHCSTDPPAAARAPATGWEARTGALRRWLQVEPGDERAWLRLARGLMWQALQEAQRAYPTERAATDEDAAALETWSAEVVRHSPRLAEAHRLAEGVARHGRDRRQRGAAWALLATIERLEGSDEGGEACMANAAREDPSYHQCLVVLKQHSR
jgi:hypothetical protein